MQVKSIHTPKPEIRFYKSGLIEISSIVFRKLDLSENKKIAFVVDDKGDIYIQKNSDGIPPCACKGKFLRYHTVEVTRFILSHPDVPPGLDRVGFRTGEVENGLLPIITRRMI
jgi:hypothetical protein